ncbi:outer membrane protein [Bradyrhizobium sp. TZ2]
MRFAKDTNTLISPVAGAGNFENNDSAWVNRVGLNYRFGNPQNAYASASSRVAISPDPCGPSRFGGGYVGGNLGMVSATARRGDRDLYFFGEAGNEQSASVNSFTAGAQAGWDWRSCNTLLGVVADWNWANADTQMPVRFRSRSFGDMNTGMDWFATVRGRAGLVVDNTLVYVTGGVAAASIGTIGLRQSNDPDIEESFAFGKTRLGLVGGVGAEFALSGNWSMNTELLYMQFSKSTDTFNSPQTGIASFESHDSAWVSRAGLNYRWGNPGVAKALAATSCGPARFAGGYVGGNVGAIHHTALNRDQNGYISDPAEYTSTTGAVTAGVQTGYDWQSCTRVFGVVADWNWTNANSIARAFPNSPSIFPDASIRSNLDWYGTARARAGLAVDDVLVYVTGGLAFARTDSKVVNIADTNNEQFKSQHMRWGWAGGAGTEVALANNWSVNGEVLYMQFAKSTDTFISPAQNNGAVGLVRDDSAWIGRVGVNYRWGTSTN